MWDRLTLVTAPAVVAVSLAEAKEHLRVEADDHDDDFLIQGLLDAAIATIDGPEGIGAAMVTQTWRLSLDCLFSPIRVPIWPLRSVTGITYVDDDGATQTLSSSLYRVNTDRRPGVIERAYNASYPNVIARSGAVKITFTAGFGSLAADTPRDLRAAILLIVGHLYANREAVVIGSPVATVPMAAEAILNRYRTGMVA